MNGVVLSVFESEMASVGGFFRVLCMWKWSESVGYVCRLRFPLYGQREEADQIDALPRQLQREGRRIRIADDGPGRYKEGQSRRDQDVDRIASELHSWL